jgi:hypothetical protein
MRKVSVEERRARVGWRHHLAGEARGEDVVEVARHLIGLHSTDPATVFLAAGARMVEPKVAAIEQALYDDRRLVRMLAMRRTMWVVPTDTLPVVEAAATKAVAERERKRLIKAIDEIGVASGDDGGSAAWLEAVEAATLGALEARGGAAFGTELSADVPGLRTSYVYAEGKTYGGQQNLTTRILNVMSMWGRIVRGRPRGQWNSSQYRWAPVEAWLPAGIPVLDRAAAQTMLTEAWLRGFGPASINDLKWWTGWTLGRSARRWRTSTWWRSTSTVRPGCCWPTTRNQSQHPIHGSHCSPPSIPPPWAGPSGPGTSVTTASRCSTGPGTSGPRCGATVGSSAAGLNARRPARWCSGCSRTSAPS